MGWDEAAKAVVAIGSVATTALGFASATLGLPAGRRRRRITATSRYLTLCRKEARAAPTFQRTSMARCARSSTTQNTKHTINWHRARADLSRLRRVLGLRSSTPRRE